METPAAYIGNVDVDGRFKLGILGPNEVPVSYPGALSAPGMRIPRLTADGQWQATYGTGYAGGAAAAVFANLLGALGKKEPKELIDLVRKTARHLDQRDPTISVIDQTAALGAATASNKATPSAHNVCGQ